MICNQPRAALIDSGTVTAPLPYFPLDEPRHSHACDVASVPLHNPRSYTLENAITPVPLPHQPDSTAITGSKPTFTSTLGVHPEAAPATVAPVTTAGRRKLARLRPSTASGPVARGSSSQVRVRKRTNVACLLCRKRHKACSPASDSSGNGQCR